MNNYERQPAAEVEYGVEEYFLGSANYPSEYTFRIDETGDPSQIRRDIILEGLFFDGSTGASLEEVEWFREDHTDLSVKMTDGYTAECGYDVPRTVRLVGWRDLTEDERDLYTKLKGSNYRVNRGDS